MIYTALWLANTKESNRQATILAKQLEVPAQVAIAKGIPHLPPIENMEIRSPAIIDMLWASFFATGDERYVKRIITLLPWSETNKHDQSKKIIGDTARSSLASNAIKHKRVMAICENAIHAQPELKPILDNLIENAKKIEVSK